MGREQSTNMPQGTHIPGLHNLGETCFFNAMLQVNVCIAVRSASQCAITLNSHSVQGLCTGARFIEQHPCVPSGSSHCCGAYSL